MRDISEVLKAGAYGVTRDGNKVRVIYVLDEIALVAVHKTAWEFETYSKFPSYHSFGSNSGLDIVGLWEDKYEPFNLDRALAGDLVINDAGFRFWVVKKSNVSDQYITEFMDGSTGCQSLENLNKCYMYKDDAENRSGMVTLPTPIKDFGDLKEVWYINKTRSVYEPSCADKKADWAGFQYRSLKNNCYYATKEDCQKICDWLMNR